MGSLNVTESHADMWIDHMGLRRRAVYRAESPDGTAFLVKFSGDRHSSIAWIPSTRVVEFIRTPVKNVKTPSAVTTERIRRILATEASDT